MPPKPNTKPPNNPPKPTLTSPFILIQNNKKKQSIKLKKSKTLSLTNTNFKSERNSDNSKESWKKRKN